jgi:hypothetical protein
VGSPATVTFTLGTGSAPFDEAIAAGEGCTAPAAGPAVCTLASPLDSIVLAGLGGGDELTASGFPSTTSVMLLGGEGGDVLTGGSTAEDVLVDGPGSGSDELKALGRDDALMHNGGPDARYGGAGNDLFLSNSICDGDLLDGGEGRDNSSWTKLNEPVEANLSAGRSGRPTSGDMPACSEGGSLDTLQQVEDLEGTGFADSFYGSAGENQLLGWKGADSYFAQAGDDSILANSGDADLVIECGEGKDSALIDEVLDPAPTGCETVNGVGPGETLEEELLPPPPSPPPPADTTPPQTQIRHRPPKLARARELPRQVAFRFGSEAGARFRCKLDDRGYSGCGSPRRYRVGRGRHAFRVFAIDAAGNRDPSPALFRFRLERVSGR